MNNNSSNSGHGPHRDLSKEAFWRRTLSEFAAGGQSIRAFCRQRGLTEPSFYAWRRAIAGRDRKMTASPDAGRPRFVELCATQPVRGSVGGSDDAPLEIVAGKHRLLIRSGCDRALLRDVLAALEGQSSMLEA